MIINRVLSTKDVGIAFHVTLVKLNAMEKLDEINIIIQLKVENDQYKFETISTTVLRDCHFKWHMKTMKNAEAL